MVAGGGQGDAVFGGEDGSGGLGLHGHVGVAGLEGGGGERAVGGGGGGSSSSTGHGSGC